MNQWKHTRFVGVALLAALLLGAAPPVCPQEEAGPSFGLEHALIGGGPGPAGVLFSIEPDAGPPALLEPNSPHNWFSGPVSTIRRESVMVNHVFAVALQPGSLLPGGPEFLICPPNLSDAPEHLGEGLGGQGLDAETVSVDLLKEFREPPTRNNEFWQTDYDALEQLSNARGPRPFRSWGDWQGALPHDALRQRFLGLAGALSPLLCRYWDVLPPQGAFSAFQCEAVPKAGHVHFLFTGEVPPGRKLMARPVASSPGARSAFDPILPYGMIRYESLEDAAADEGRRLQFQAHQLAPA